LEKNNETIAIEVKAAKKLSSSDLTKLRYWQKNQPNNYIILINGEKQFAELETNSSVLLYIDIGEI